MEVWEHKDDDGPIESYSGYLGLCIDGEFYPEAPLKPLEGFDFELYGELVEEHGVARELRLEWGSIAQTIIVENSEVVELLDKLPTVTVYVDDLPGTGPGTGSVAFPMFLTAGVSEADLIASIDALSRALRSDLAWLEARYPREPHR